MSKEDAQDRELSETALIGAQLRSLSSDHAREHHVEDASAGRRGLCRRESGIYTNNQLHFMRLGSRQAYSHISPP
jgi:hypothetical protein